MAGVIKEERRVAEKEYFKGLVENGMFDPLSRSVKTLTLNCAVCDKPFKEGGSSSTSSPLQLVLQSKHTCYIINAPH